MDLPADNPVVAHARGALARARASADGLPSLAPPLRSLLDCFEELEQASEAQLAVRWSRFFRCYDDFLAALRAAEAAKARRDGH